MSVALLPEREALEYYGLRPKFPESIDSSMLKDFVNCPMLFYLRHVLGLRKKNMKIDETSHLDWGTMWHKLMETMDQTGEPVEALKCLHDWPPSLVPETDKHGRGKERMMHIFFNYLERFQEKDRIEFEIVRQEQFFDVYNEELDIRWCGRIDRVVERKFGKGELIAWDYKTTSRMGQNWFEEYEYSFQLPGYVWALNQISNEPVRKLKIDALYILKASHDFFRRTIKYEEPDLAEWVRNVKFWLERLYWLRDNHLDEPEYWPMNRNECTRYGLCQFSDVCFTSPIRDSRFRILGEDYYEDRWDPRVRED